MHADSAVYFERQLTRFTVLDELFGPLSIRALEDDRFERRVEGYLPAAHVVFLDELFKCSSAVLNALLSVMNERTFVQGARTEPVPLVCLVAASNEAPESEDLDALVDRFLFSLRVVPVSRSSRRRLLQAASRGLPEHVVVDDVPPLCLRAVARLRDAAAAHCILSDAAEALLLRVVRDAEEAIVATAAAAAAEAEGAVIASDDAEEGTGRGPVSDRRLARTARALRVAAASCGRALVSPWDVLLVARMWPTVVDVLKSPEALLDTVIAEATPRSALLPGLSAATLGLYESLFAACEVSAAQRSHELSAEMATVSRQAEEVLSTAAVEHASIRAQTAADASLIGSHAWLSASEKRRALNGLRAGCRQTCADLKTVAGDVAAIRTLASMCVEGASGAWPSANSAFVVAPLLGVCAVNSRLHPDAPARAKQFAMALMDGLGPTR